MNQDVADYNHPKSPMTSYTTFVQIVKEEHQRRYPELNFVFSELAKMCAEKWRTMSAEDRMRFDELAKIDKTNYQRRDSNPECNGRLKKRKTLKDPSKPKRALSAFFFFCDVYRPKVRAEHPEWRVSEVAKELGKLWEICSERTKYEALSQADRKRYNEEMQKYNSGPSASSISSKNSIVLMDNSIGQDDTLKSNTTTNTTTSSIGNNEINYLNPEDEILSEDNSN